MTRCCSRFHASVRRQFDDDVARKDLERYREKGPNVTTERLRDGLARAGCRSVIDVGAGVGALSFELLEGEAERAVAVEASPAFAAAARQEIADRGLEDRFTVLEGDFTELAPELEPAEAVAMDRVVCCYPEFRPLLEAALGRSRRLFAYSYPRDRWYVRLKLGLQNLARALTGNPFRMVVHPEEAMGACIDAAGFRRVSRSHTLAWDVELYERESPGSRP